MAKRRRRTLCMSNGRSLRRVRAALSDACSALSAAKSMIEGHSTDSGATVWMVCEQARNKCALALTEINDGSYGARVFIRAIIKAGL